MLSCLLVDKLAVLDCGAIRQDDDPAIRFACKRCDCAFDIGGITDEALHRPDRKRLSNCLDFTKVATPSGTFRLHNQDAVHVRRDVLKELQILCNDRHLEESEPGGVPTRLRVAFYKARTYRIARNREDNRYGMGLLKYSHRAVLRT